MKLKLFISVLMALVLTSSCSKEAETLIKGNYTFKTSGVLEFEAQPHNENSENHSFKLALAPEAGQMKIFSDENGSMFLSMNIIGGDLLFFSAAIDENDVLILEPVNRVMTFRDSLGSFTMEVQISGSGRLCDGVFVAELLYSGTGSNNLYDYTLISSDIRCVATRNNEK